MKRITVLLSLVLVLALSMGAMAQFKLSGQVGFDAYLRQKWDDTEEEHGDLEFWAQGRSYARLAMSGSGQSGSLKLILGFGNNQAGRHQNDTNVEAWIPWTGEPFKKSEDVAIKLDSAKIEATGALWKGGDSLTAIFGRHNTGYSSWVGHSRVRNTSNTTHRDAFRNSVEVKGLKLGPLTVSAAHGYSQVAGEEPSFIHASGNFGGIDTKVTAVNRQVIGALDDTVWDMAAELKMKPMADLDLSGAIALDGQGQGVSGNIGTEIAPKIAFQADAKLTSIPSVTLTGSAWMAENGFAPRYAQWDKDWKDYTDTKVGRPVAFQTNRQGFKVGAETTQSGVKLTGSFANETNVDKDNTDKWAETIIGAGASTSIEGFDLGADVTLTDRDDADVEMDEIKTVLSVGTKLADVNVKYTGTIENKKKNDAGTETETDKFENKVTANVAYDLFFADNVKFDAAVIHTTETGEEDKLDYGVDASWKAPNGLNFVVGYATYNKSGDRWVHKKNPDGFYIRDRKSVV